MSQLGVLKNMTVCIYIRSTISSSWSLIEIFSSLFTGRPTHVELLQLKIFNYVILIDLICDFMEYTCDKMHL